jgi:hypothetical protein
MRLLSLAAVFAFGAHASAAPPVDVAELFPPTALAYAELNAPAELAPQFAALVKGTALEDGFAFVHDRKKGAKTLADLKAQEQLAALALLASPEVLAEFGKVRGAAVALLGFNENGQPDVAVAVLTGESAALGLAARALVTAAPNVRKVGEVGKVPVFQFRAPAINIDNNTGRQMLDTEKQPAEGAHELTLAYVPGLFVAGTGMAAVAQVLTRFAGEGKGTLRDAPGFKESAAEWRKPGLFFYANVPDLAAKLNDAARADPRAGDADWLTQFRLLAGGKAAKHLAGRAHFRDGGLAVDVSVALDPAQPSPLGALLTGGAANWDRLRHARKPALGAVAVALPPKDRGAAVAGILDALAKAGGEIGRLPSDVLKDLQEKQKVPVGDALFAKLNAVTVILPHKQELPKGATPLPVFVLHCETAEAATAWEAALPKLIGELAGEPAPKPSSETVGSVKVYSLAAAVPWKAPLHYARDGATLTLGLDRKLVAGALAADAVGALTGDSALSLPATARGAVGALNLGAALEVLLAPRQPAAPNAPGAPPPRGRGGEPRVAPPAVEEPPAFDPDGRPVGPEARADAEKARAALATALGDLTVVLGARARATELRFELFVPKVQNGGLKSVIAAGANWVEKEFARSGLDDGRGPYGRFGGER